MTITSVDTLILARWLIPVQPQRTMLEHHAIAIDDGNIVDLLPIGEAQARYQSDNTIDLSEHHVVLPGLINSHGHSAMSLMRGMADDYPLQQWLNEHIWPAEQQWVSEDFVKDGSELALAEMIQSGTTCFSDMYFFPNITAKAADAAGIRAQLSFPVFGFPSAWGTGPDDYLHKGLQLRDDYKHHPLVEIVFGPHAPYTNDDPTLQRISTLSFELDCPVQIHLHETQQEVDDALADSGKRPLARLNDLGLLGPRTQCVHMTALNDVDIELLKNSGAQVVHCPQSNMKLASGACPTARLLAEGINVSLGTDGAASNNSLNLFAEMRSAALLGKLAAKDAAAVDDWQALEMATINGARSLGIDDLTGSLEAGKAADIIAVDLGQLPQQPVFHPISQLVYTECGHRVSDSWVDGRQLLKQGQLTTLDSHRIINKAQHWRDKISR